MYNTTCLQFSPLSPISIQLGRQECTAVKGVRHLEVNLGAITSELCDLKYTMTMIVRLVLWCECNDVRETLNAAPETWQALSSVSGW